MNKVECPCRVNGKHCGGIAERLNYGTTYMMTMIGADKNQISETFQCTKCGKKFHRTWKWEDV